MRESFSIPENFAKKQTKEEIAEGLFDVVNPEIDEIETWKPLSKKDWGTVLNVVEQPGFKLEDIRKLPVELHKSAFDFLLDYNRSPFDSSKIKTDLENFGDLDSYYAKRLLDYYSDRNHFNDDEERSLNPIINFIASNPDFFLIESQRAKKEILVTAIKAGWEHLFYKSSLWNDCYDSDLALEWSAIDQSYFLYNIEKFKDIHGIDKVTIVNNLIKSDALNLVDESYVKKAASFLDIPIDRLAERYFELHIKTTKDGVDVLPIFAPEYIKKNTEKIVEKMDTAGYLEKLLANPDFLETFSSETATILLSKINKNNGWYFIRSIEKFPSEFHEEIARKTMDREWNYLLSNIEKFHDAYFKKEVFRDLIDANVNNSWEYVAIEKFPQEFHEEIARKIVVKDPDYFLYRVKKFKGAYFEKEVFSDLITMYNPEFILGHIKKFPSEFHEQVLKSLIKKGKLDLIVDTFKNKEFKGSYAESISQMSESLSLNIKEVLQISDYFPEDFEQLSDEEKAKTIFKLLKENAWKDEWNLSGPFESGAEIFSYRLMFEYLNRENLTRHDGLHAFNKIIDLYKATGLKPNQFYGNILKQVSMDDKEYDAGTAHHHLNSLARTLDIDFTKILTEAKQYPDITSLQELVKTFDSPKKIFESWNNLKRYAELVKILEQKEILERLKGLKNTGQEALYTYVEKLAFHPSSKVDMQSVIQFWQKPGAFLGASASHTPERIQNAKKPSNYTEIPNLDLSAEQLRDTLVEGGMDGLQVFSPMEIEYKIPIKGKEQVFIAKINKKSDPDAVLAGNDTACCMPFGDGKNTIYTFNPNVALFTLQVRRQDGITRTIAQSVLTKDKDVGVAVPTIVEKMQQVGGHLSEIASEDILKKSTAYLSCDNVEVAPNYKQGEYAGVIKSIYQNFFTEYMRQFGNLQNLATDKVIIGQGYSDALTDLPQGPNTYVPLAPVGYSDKTGKNIFVLDLQQPDTNLKGKVSIPEITPRSETKLKTRGVSYLTFEDTLPVSYLEGKVYSDNETLLVNLHNIENGLIAKDINNSTKDRPNMSLKYTDVKGDIKGYLMAYEGRHTQGNNEPVIYIADLAAEKESKTAGGRLIQAFTELYKQNYLEQGKLTPIFAQARETTSYKIIQKQLEGLSQSLGLTFELKELSTYTSGQDTMHPVIIRPVQRVKSGQSVVQ